MTFSSKLIQYDFFFFTYCHELKTIVKWQAYSLMYTLFGKESINRNSDPCHFKRHVTKQVL